jgi:hypothetical protein
VPPLLNRPENGWLLVVPVNPIKWLDFRFDKRGLRAMLVLWNRWGPIPVLMIVSLATRSLKMTTETKKPVVLHLGDFTVECLGVEYPDYFQGYGLGPSSDYDHCTYGIGNTEAEALEDCMEMMAQAGTFDFDDEAERRIREEYGRADDNVTAADELGVDEDDEECAFDDFPAYWHIGIKWNIREDQRYQRYQRIRNIPNIQPLRYEDYRPLHPSNRYPGLQEWGYARRADGSGSYGDFKETDWPDSAEEYLGSLCEDIEETAELYFYVPYASGSDYSGSTCEKANAKCVEESYGEHDWVHPVYGGHGTYAVAIGITGLLSDCDDDTFDEFCETLEDLADYPVIDEEALCEYEMEGADEAWESWCKGDFTRALEKEYEDEADFEWPDDSTLRAFFEERREDANEYWFNEGYGPDMYVRVDEVVKGITFDDVSKWAVRYEVSYCNPGEETEVYYNEDDAIGRVEELRASGIIGASYRILGTEASDETDETDTNG